MTSKTLGPWLGALVATPALTAVCQPAVARTAPAVASTAVSYVAADSRAALRAGLLSMTLDEKLMIAGDRLGVDPLADLTLRAGSGRTYGATVMRTNTNIPECQSPTGVKGSGSDKGSYAPKTNMDAPECHAALGKCGSTRTGVAPRTNTDIPECRGPAARKCGSTGSGFAPRTNTDIPECRGPAAGKCGATKGGVAPRTNTDIPECRAPGAKCGASSAGHQMLTKAAITGPTH